MQPLFKKYLEERLKVSEGNNLIIENVELVGGGCINQTARLKTNTKDFFVKWNVQSDMLLLEEKGLKELSSAEVISIPKVIGSGDFKDTSFLLLEFISSFQKKEKFWRQFGRELAQLHKKTNANYGLIDDNYIGSLPQKNKKYTNWIDFFINQRIEVQLQIGKNKIPKRIREKAEKLYDILPNLFSEEPPSLLHGDLWSGNYMVGVSGQPMLIDPAIYYGNREMDLAMTKLFGGFPEEFYSSYKEEYPLEKGSLERFKICNLYPLLVHVNLFGGAYLQQVENILDKHLN